MTVTDAAPSTVTLGIDASLLRGAHLRGPMAVFIGLPLLALVWVMPSLHREGAGAGEVIATLWSEMREAPKFPHW